jgi:hypothetical protein
MGDYKGSPVEKELYSLFSFLLSQKVNRTGACVLHLATKSECNDENKKGILISSNVGDH